MSSRSSRSPLSYQRSSYAPTKGFTVVELLIVILVIGIIAAITIVAWNGAQRRGYVATVVSDLSSARDQLKLDKYDLGKYPTTVDAADSGNGLKASEGTEYQYTVDNSVDPPTFCLTGINGDVTYMVTESTQPAEGVCPGHLAPGMVASASDDFNRTASSLGAIPDTNLTWVPLAGTWSTNGSVATTSAAPSSNPLAVIDFGTGDVDESISTSTSGGGDSLIIRATDANNYIRARYSHTQSTSSSTTQGYCYKGSWQYQGKVYTEGHTPGTTIPKNKVSDGYCYSADEYPGWNGTGAAKGKTYVTNSPVTCEPPYTTCYWGDSYTRTVYNVPDSTTYSTNNYYYVYLEKVVNGTVTNLYSSGNLGSGVSKLRLLAKGQTISLYINGSSTARTTVSEAFNQTATKHGIGRGSSNVTGSALDNFSITRS